MTTFNINAATHLLNSAFAPWVLALDLTVESLGDASAVIRMTFSESLCRDNGVICGQSLMALADTAMVIAVGARQWQLSADDNGRPDQPLSQTGIAH